MARFFHPSKKIRDQWPNDDKRRLTDVLVTGEATHAVRHKQQLGYLVCIQEINDGTEFYIVKRNFKIVSAPPTPFASKEPQAADGPPVPNNARERQSSNNVTSNIVGGMSRAATREEIEELRRQGITVDDDNEPAPENAQPPVPQGPAPPPGNWEKPTYCPRRANSDFSDQEGRFINHRWDAIADYNELDLFRMCFSEEWVLNSLIPMTNKELGKKTNLQEFYVFLGCIFFMACYDGVPNREMWWSTNPIHVTFSVERLHVEEALRRNNASTPVHRQGSALVLP
jgi:hypothetical protein